MIQIRNNLGRLVLRLVVHVGQCLPLHVLLIAFLHLQDKELIYHQLRPVLCDFLGKELISDEDQSQINKDMYDSGVGACSGNTLPEAFQYLYRLGTCLETCGPYSNQIGLASESRELPLCSDVFGKDMLHCVDGSPIRIFRSIQVYRVPGTKQDNGTERDIKEDIFCYGPVCTGINF